MGRCGINTWEGEILGRSPSFYCWSLAEASVTLQVLCPCRIFHIQLSGESSTRGAEQEHGGEGAHLLFFSFCIIISDVDFPHALPAPRKLFFFSFPFQRFIEKQSSATQPCPC